MWNSNLNCFRSFTGALTACLFASATLSGLVSAAPRPVSSTSVKRRTSGFNRLKPRLDVSSLVPDDAADDSKVLQWLQENSGVQATDNLVFYTQDDGRDSAMAFADANGKVYFGDLFGPDSQFAQDFGANSDADYEVAQACSRAMANFAAGQTWVFNDDNAQSPSTWTDIEKPILMSRAEVTNIWSMEDASDEPDDADKDLKNADGSDSDSDDDAEGETDDEMDADGETDDED
ncbi:hypothetical protein F5Y15DRAFT_147445 [Xylariaceae sp. FL0016]|nr:hypothetical protein F5Y15DRAFT_147445 [Xylariaceae sp. FL0016]